jgi:hypothetical protein
MVLGDFARVAEGKLDILGAGWKLTGPGPATFGVGLIIETFPGEFGASHKLVLELVDEDGQLVQTPEEDEPLLRLEGDVEVIPPPGHPPALPLVLPIGFNAANIPLPAGRRLEFRLWIDKETKESWTLPFWTREEGAEPPDEVL